jgi:hypothetical protein
MTVTLPAYFEIADAAALRFFRCGPLRSTLSDRACATNFLRSQRLHPDQVASCKGCANCELGALHAGVPFKRRSGLHGMSICTRCRKHSMRQIAGIHCPSCYNRALELAKGRNAKGTPPQCASLLARRIGVVVDGKAMELRAEKTRDATELIVAVLRYAEGRTTFHRPRRGPATALGDWVRRQQPRGGLDPRMLPERQQQRTIVANEARRQRHAEVPLVAAE